jgi:DNA (cytosine-5)-methyltransferase 1
VSDGKMKEYWENRKPEDTDFSYSAVRLYGKRICFNNKYVKKDEVCSTLTSNDDTLYLFDEYRKPNREEVCCISTFPQDYDFMDESFSYICGMSVPPVMMANVATEIYKQWNRVFDNER